MVIDCSICPEDQGACCGLMIFEKSLVQEFEDKIEEGFIDIIKKGNHIFYHYEDLRCPFLDRKTRLCKIYESRPKICRDYGYIDKLQCPYFKKSGNRRSKASQTQIERQLDRQLNILEKQK